MRHQLQNVEAAADKFVKFIQRLLRAKKDVNVKEIVNPPVQADLIIKTCSHKRKA